MNSAQPGSKNRGNYLFFSGWKIKLYLYCSKICASYTINNTNTRPTITGSRQFSIVGQNCCQKMLVEKLKKWDIWWKFPNFCIIFGIWIFAFLGEIDHFLSSQVNLRHLLESAIDMYSFTISLKRFCKPFCVVSGGRGYGTEERWRWVTFRIIATSRMTFFIAKKTECALLLSTIPSNLHYHAH